MASFFDHGLVKTVVVEQVVAPLACHLCHLVLLCENGMQQAERLSWLEGPATAVARATSNMAAVAYRHISETEDEVVQRDMSSLLDSVTVSGRHVLLAAQKLSIQPSLAEHREELITAAQNVFLGVVQVLLVEDDATVRKILAAADRVSESLSELGSSLEIKLLLKSFQVFSEALLLLRNLTEQRATSLLDPGQRQHLLNSLETLGKCISMLHTAMYTTIKHPASQQAQAAKTYILDKVEHMVADIIATVKNERCGGSPGPGGFYTQRRDDLLELLASCSACSLRHGGLDSLVRNLVFHCMVVANTSRRESQRKVVGHCHHVLRLWSEMRTVLKCPEDPAHPEDRLQSLCTSLRQRVRILDGALMTAVIYQVSDAYLAASSTFEELLSVTRRVLDAGTPEVDLDYVQPLLEDFIAHTDRITQVAGFTSAVSVDAESQESVENSRACLARLRARIASLSLELGDDSPQTLQSLQELCERWAEEIGQLQDALSDVLDVRDFTSVTIQEIVNDRHGCDIAYKEQNYEMFQEQADNLLCHLRQVTHSVKRHLDRSDDPIYRNGLLVLLKQAQSTQTNLAGSVRDILVGSSLNVEVYPSFSDDVFTAIQDVKVLRQGLDGQQHPHLLSPLREEARQPLASPSPAKHSAGLHPGRQAERIHSPVGKVGERDLLMDRGERRSERKPVEAVTGHENASGDLQMPAVSDELKPICCEPRDFELLPILHQVMTVTKGKDVTVLNQACAGVLQLSNCYAQATKEASSILDDAGGETLANLRAELVSLTPLLVQTAQEAAMSSATGTESVYKHGTMFSDLINSIRKILTPVAGSWYQAIHAMLAHRPTMAAAVVQQLSHVTGLCGNVVQLLTSSDIANQSEGQESFTALHGKLNKAQNSTRCLSELCSSAEGQVDRLEAPCVLWAVSLQILLNSLDKILGTSSVMRQISPKKKLSALSENSLRIREAVRLTILNCRSTYKVKQYATLQDELRTLTETYLQMAEDLGLTPSVLQLAKSEFLQRELVIKSRVLLGHLDKANKDYVTPIRNIVNVACVAAKRPREDDNTVAEHFENAAQTLLQQVQAAATSVEDCLHYVRDPRSRSSLRSITDHLAFQISDVVSRARLVVETRCTGDTLSLEVRTQCWSAKARYVVEEINKVDGLNQAVKERIKVGLQGGAPEDIEAKLTDIAVTLEQGSFPTVTPLMPLHTVHRPAGHAGAAHVPVPVVPTHEAGLDKPDGLRPAAWRDVSSLTYTSLFLKQETDSWDPQDNRIVQVTRKMADKIHHMTQYLRRKGPIPNKDALSETAKEVISDCRSVTQFVRVLASHCLDEQCTVELSLIVEQILTVTNQLNIISSVNAMTPGCKSSDEILVKNAQNLLQTVLLGVRAAETACIKGLRQPEPNSDGAEAAALCFQWRRNLQIHRAQQNSNPETDDLGLRKTSPRPVAPSLVPRINPREGYR